MESIVEVKPLDNYHIWVKFADNFSATINIKPFINKGISSELSEINYFKQVRIDPFGGITLENGFDFCPNFLRELSRGKES
jgi:hypothetical protein